MGTREHDLDPDTLPRIIRITVPGPPVAKPRMTRRDKWKKRPCVLRYREWCDQARSQPGRDVPPAEEVFWLSWTAYFRPPPSWSKRRQELSIGQLHRVRPDRDNLDKAILDCLYPKGDAAIALGTIEKRWDWVPRVEIVIACVPQLEGS